jgi:DNA-binding transcriptional regulator YdaS (Cro superfamily)
MHNPNMSGIAEAIAIAGSISAVARTLGVSYQAVQQWALNGYVPIGRVAEIEATYGVPRARLAPPKYLVVLPAQFGEG